MTDFKKERDAQWVQRSTILVDPTRNMARGGRAIDPDAASTIELSLLIEAQGQLEPVRIKLLPRATPDGQTMRLVWGYRRIAAMDRLHRQPDGTVADYRIHVLPSNATTDLEEFAENFGENIGHLPPNDWDLGEGLSMVRKQHNLSVDLLLMQLFATKLTKAPSGATFLGREHAKKAMLTWENLIEPLRILWRKNTSLFQLTTGRPCSAWEASKKTPVEQEQLIDQIVHEAEQRKERVALGLEGLDKAEDLEKPKTVRRPTVRQIHAAASWLKQHAGDSHDDGLTRDQRVFARRYTRWILGIPGPDGALPPCPIKKRVKVQLEDDEGETG